MFKVRDNEPTYAFISDSKAPLKNQYGTEIDLANQGDALAGKSLNINGDSFVSDNPDRYKQHGFYFNADNCIACHACESACSEKNDLPPHLAYRSVGYVEGGSYPDYTRLNISMACNHCDDPVCLKGCPTRAYTKFAEYGAVLQDPDICFGCGYCTWVCPYNAPQLDTEKGHVQKCNMCVDRLEVGLKPACVSACLANALDFGVIETTPENRDQLQTQIPGFPTPEITHPNIRFQQTRSLPKEMTRPDSMPLRYEQDQQGAGEFKTKVRDLAEPRQWNFSKLRSREDPLVIFTLVSQAVIGAFILMFLASTFPTELGLHDLSISAYPTTYSFVLFALLGMETIALTLSTMHLGKPQRFYRAFYNLRYSPVSREVAGIAVFFNLLGLYTLLVTFPILFNWLLSTAVLDQIINVTGWTTVISGPIALYFMYKIYRIKARPFWDHWQVLTSFYGNMLTLGSMLLMLVFGAVLLYFKQDIIPLFTVLGATMLLGLIMEATGLYYHARDLQRQGGEGAASHYLQTTRFGKTYILRNIMLGVSIVASITLLLLAPLLYQEGILAYILWLCVMAVAKNQALIGRSLFYVLVVPTTMPGAFFWRNRGFEEHARDSGLAEMQQVGVLPETH